MEYLEKGTLKSLINKQGKLSERELKRVTAQLLVALDHLHRMEIVHCDIKPDNILVGSGNTVKIADFGLAQKAAKG